MGERENPIPSPTLYCLSSQSWGLRKAPPMRTVGSTSSMMQMNRALSKRQNQDQTCKNGILLDSTSVAVKLSLGVSEDGQDWLPFIYWDEILMASRSSPGGYHLSLWILWLDEG